MATLYIHQYSRLAEDARGAKMPVPDDFLGVLKVAVGASTAQSSALNNRCQFVELVTDTDCQWARGANPTADANSRFLPANVLGFYPVNGGDLVAVIQQQ